MNKLRVELEKGYIGRMLAEDVYKEKEMMLIGKDNLLSERLFDSLKKHGIRHIYVYEMEQMA